MPQAEHTDPNKQLCTISDHCKAASFVSMNHSRLFDFDSDFDTIKDSDGDLELACSCQQVMQHVTQP
jgi:hypothetical protein